MPWNVRWVRERIGEEITDPSQLVGWRDRRLEREERQRQAELERQRDLERRRAAGEIIPEDEVPSNTSTSPTRRRRRSFPPPDTRPLTERRMTRAVARALAATGTSAGSPNNDTASTSANDDDESDDPLSPPASSPTTANPAVLPVVSGIAVDEEEPRDVEMVDEGVMESVNDQDFNHEDVQQQISEPSTSREDQRPMKRRSVKVSQPSIADFRNILRIHQTNATVLGGTTHTPASASAPVTCSEPTPALAPATVQVTPKRSSPVFPSIFGRPLAPAAAGDAPSNASEQLDMARLDPALFEPVREQNFTQQLSAPGATNEKPPEPSVRQVSQPIPKPRNVQAGKIPASNSTIVGSATKSRPNIAIPALRPVVARAPAPIFTLATAPTPTPAVAPVATRSPHLSPASVAAPFASPASVSVPTLATAPATTPAAVGASANRQIPQPATGQSEARVKAAYQLVPVVDIVKRLFLESLATLQSPTPEMVTAEARLFLARAQENDTAGAVKKAATLLSSITQGKIDELTRGPVQFEVVSEILRQRLQLVFLQELLK